MPYQWLLLPILFWPMQQTPLSYDIILLSTFLIQCSYNIHILMNTRIYWWMACEWTALYAKEICKITCELAMPTMQTELEGNALNWKWIKYCAKLTKFFTSTKPWNSIFFCSLISTSASCFFFLFFFLDLSLEVKSKKKMKNFGH